jgi:hypothetical protein
MVYDLYFGDKLQPWKATSPQQAVDALYGYVEAILKEYLHSSAAPANEKTWIMIYDPISATMRQGDKQLALTFLKTDHHCSIFGKTTSTGVYEQARTEEHQYEKSSVPTIEQQHLATQQATSAVGRILTTDNPVSTGGWKPSDIHEVHILQAAEVRLFALSLRRVIQKLPVEGRAVVDRQCEFVEGTVSKMLHPVDPLRPTQKQIDRLARVLRVKPNNLWVDLVPYFWEHTDNWPTVADSSLPPF